MSDRLVMIRPGLQDLPDHPAPAGFSLRMHGPGDERAWTRIQQRADRLTAVTAELFATQFGGDPGLHGGRIFYLDDEGGLTVGTAAAWFGDGRDAPAEVGRLHWLAVDPDFQGRGLSYPLTAAVLSRLRELGHSRAYLVTSTLRPAAVHLYKKFGFRVEQGGIPG